MLEPAHVNVFIHDKLKIYLESHLELVPDGVQLEIVDLIVDYVMIPFPYEVKYEAENISVIFNGQLGITEHEAIYHITFNGEEIIDVRLKI